MGDHKVKKYRYGPGTALFNGHLNDAADHAKEIFIAQFGQEAWDERIQPIEDAGLMSIFNKPADFYTAFYVTAIMLFVNEDAVPLPAELKDDGSIGRDTAWL